MIQTYNDLLQQINNFGNLSDEDHFIQKIYSSARYICLQVRCPGVTKFVYFGRGNSYEGVWLGTKQIPSEIRAKDRFLEYLRKYLPGKRLSSLSLDSDDRIISFNYEKFGQQCSLMIFYKGRETYFAHSFFTEKGPESLVSWNPKKINRSLESTVFDQVGRKKLDSSNKHSKIIAIEELVENEINDARKGKRDSKKTKSLKRKIKNIERDLTKLNKYEDLQSLAQESISLEDLPMKTKIFDVKFNFSSKEHFKRRDEIFNKAKKFKKVIDFSEQRLQATKEELASGKNIAVSSLKVISPVWRKVDQLESQKVVENKENYKVHSFVGFRIAIGLTSQGNDEARKSFSSSSDLWFHLESGSSPHLILKITNGESLSDKHTSEVGKIIKSNMNLETSEINLIYTQVKNLKGVRGSPGKVTYKNIKYLRVYL